MKNKDLKLSMKPQIEQLANACKQHQLLIACAESCTGGWLAKVLTDLPGSSTWFAGGVVSYSNHLKQQVLGVPAALLREQGAVSLPVVEAMARGVLAVAEAGLAISISGIAGPDGGSVDKPVGTVCFGWADASGAFGSKQYQFSGNRNAIRLQAVETAIELLLAQLTQGK